jgi:hypothetical protein
MRSEKCSIALRASLAVVVALGIAACGGPIKSSYDMLRDGRVAYVNQNPNLDPAIRAAILEGRLREGMTQGDVRASWGEPLGGNRLAGNLVEWVFGCDQPHYCTTRGTLFGETVYHHSRAYFRDGRLASWSQ